MKLESASELTIYLFNQFALSPGLTFYFSLWRSPLKIKNQTDFILSRLMFDMHFMIGNGFNFRCIGQPI